MRFDEFKPLNEGPADVAKGIYNFGKSLITRGSKVAGNTGTAAKAAAVAPKVASKSVLSTVKIIASLPAKAVAKTVIGSLKGNGLLLKSIVGAPFLYGLYSKYAELEEQYKKYSNGDTTTQIFGNMSAEEAKQKFESTKTEIIGEGMLVIGPMLTKTDVIWSLLGKGPKAVGSIGGAVAGGSLGSQYGIFGAITGAKLGSKVLGSVAGAPFTIAALFSKMISGGITGPLFILFVQSDAGQNFFHNVMKDSLTTFLGTSGQLTFQISETAGGWIQSFFTNNKDAITKNAATGVGAVRTNSSPTQSAEQPAKTNANNDSNSSAVPLPPEKQKIVDLYKDQTYKITFDKNNPNIMRVSGMPVTDKDGYLTLNNAELQQYKTRFDGPDPFAGLQRRPGL